MSNRKQLRVLRWAVLLVMSFATGCANSQEEETLLPIVDCPGGVDSGRERLLGCVSLDRGNMQDIMVPPGDLPREVDLLEIDDRMLRGIVLRNQEKDDVRSFSARILGQESGMAHFSTQGKTVAGVLYLGNRVIEITPVPADVEKSTVKELQRAGLPRESRPGSLNLERFDPDPDPVRLDPVQVPMSAENFAITDQARRDAALSRAYATHIPPPVIKVLVLLPANDYPWHCGRNFTETSGPSISAALRKLVAAQLAFTTSYINYPFARIDAVAECVEYTARGGNLGRDHNWLRTGYAETTARLQTMGLPFLGQVNQAVFDLRAEHKADLVSMIVPEKTVEDELSSCGYTVRPDYPDQPIRNYTDLYSNNAVYSVVVGRCVWTRLSFAHEIGHAFGMKHDRNTANNNLAHECGYGYIAHPGNQVPLGTTVLAYPESCVDQGGTEATCGRQPYFSSVQQSLYWNLHVPPLTGSTNTVAGHPCALRDTSLFDGAASNSERLRATAPYVEMYHTLMDPAFALLPDEEP